ncbi:MAG: hypothetical protein CVU64_07880 [Deltaproteobacteria bacterium HGW-Deltaproteobacteria-21]|nr:MAG: hypothetical protein CVU64_07880 [Deltaproteobacteria bacterium HGW-Deltaproteobacteria-21]
MAIAEVFCQAVFWLSLLLLFHAWVGYAIILLLIPSPAKKIVGERSEEYEPSVSVIVPVHNGGRKIGRKLENIESVSYPRDKLEIIVVSDGSTDDTVLRVKALAMTNLRLYELPYNMGKSAAQNFGAEKSNHKILLFTDVDSELHKDFVRNIVQPFVDMDIACVGGRALLINAKGEIAKSQGLYWRIEDFMRKKESDLGVVHSLPGWGLAVRKSYFSPLDLDTGDDMILPMEMALRGKRSVLVSEALVMDTMPSTMTGVFSARQRIALRNFTGIIRRKRLLAPWLFPKMSFALWSHKLLKWLSPPIIISFFLASLYLYLARTNLLYHYAFLLQVFVYSLGFFGIVIFRMGIKTKLPLIGYISSFLLANAAFLVALVKVVKGQPVRAYRNIE